MGLATARSLLLRRLDLSVLVLEKEDEVARHQSGRNSGVIHSGLYYSPGSRKARFAVEGNRRMIDYCRRFRVPHEVCGKTIVAVDRDDEERLGTLAETARENGVEVEPLTPRGIHRREPHARGRAGLWVPSTGITDFGEVTRSLARETKASGGEVRLGTALRGVEREGDHLRLETDTGSIETGYLVNCAGLHSDRVARLAGASVEARIVPFRGEYYRLAPGARSLVRNLIYPVPDPDLPFLGVHLHRQVDGEVSAGPNAVLAARREGYRSRGLSLSYLIRMATFPGFWRMTLRLGLVGLTELLRARSKRLFLRSARRLIPTLQLPQLIRAPSGVRAQALTPDGELVDDFLFAEGELSLHVLNAPSPAATASLVIGDEITDRVLGEKS